MWKHLEEISLEKMNGEDTLQESPEWVEMFSTVCVFHESILEFLPKKWNTIVDPWSTIPHWWLQHSDMINDIQTTQSHKWIGRNNYL